MKKMYETMEAYKVEFNANEQVAAAACNFFLENGKYDVASGTNLCLATESTSGPSQYMTTSGGNGTCQTQGSNPLITVQYA